MSRPEKRRAEKAYGKCKQYAKSGFMPKDPDGILDMIFVDPEVDEMLSEEFGWYNRPVIYAFKTSLVPGAIKIGFTFRYHERIEEWREKYPDLEIVGGPWDAFFLMRDTLYFFRDEPVHQNAEGQNHLFRRLAENDFAENVYPSKEFFEVISAKNEKLTKEAIANLVCEVRESILNGGRIYHYFRYDEIKKKVSADKPEKLDNFDANDRQNIAREEAKAAIEAGIVKWLLAAVMRFGKTFTSLMISKDMGAKLTVVLTGKADVRGEWRRAIFHEQLFHKRVFVEFVSGKGANHKVIVSGDYYGNGEFVWKEEVPLTNNFFKNLIDKGYSVVVFGTLQDFSGKKIGSCREIKRKHKELFNMEIDLLIIDETHYGARGTVYGKAIAKTEEDEGNEDQLKAEEREMLKEHALVEALNAKHQLHLSGTPYRIMTSGEFEADGCRVISTVSYQDQLKDKNDWLRANPDKEESDCPLFGLPTMRMYGIKLTKECREILKRSLEAGNSLSDSISALFKCDKDGKLIYEQQIRGFLGAFFNGLLKKIHEKNPFVANHLVALLPSVASCHAVADIFKEIVGSNEFNVYVAVQGKVGNTFKRWSEECKDSASLNAALSESERNGKRTIVFTVNRLMTGTTVPFWDTMLYLRGGENPEPYDQSRFRLASKNIEEYEVDGKILKMCKKNEVLFFDFQVDRMLAIRADAVRSEKKEENAIKEALDREAKQIVYKNLDTFGDKFKEYEGVDFMKALYEFGNRSFADSMSKYDALADNPNIQKIAERFSGNGFGSKAEKFSPFKGDEGADIGIEEVPETEGNSPKNGHSGSGEEHSNVSATDMKKRFKNVMLRLHFFVACLRNVFIDNGIDELYEHLAKNEVDRKLLEDEFLLTLDDIATIKENMTNGMKDMFCGECFRVTHYLNSDEYEPIDKVRFISERCAKVSESGVAVPSNIAEKMLEDALEQLNKGHKPGKILEIGSVYGEYLIEAWKIGDPKLLERFRILPLNGITGVITKRVCNLLGVSEDIVLTDLIRDEGTKMVDIKLFIDENKNEKIVKTLKEMKISATVGNPPYQITVAKKDTQNGQKRVSSIFHLFQLTCEKLSDYTSLIYPAGRWIHRSGKGLADFGMQQINDTHLKRIELFPDASEVFGEVGIPDGVCIVTKDMNKTENGFEYVYTYNNISKKDNRSNPGEELMVLNPDDNNIDKRINDTVREHNLSFLHDSVLSQKLFGIESNFVEENPELVRKYNDNDIFDEKTEIKLFTNDKGGKSGRAGWYITNRSNIKNGTEYLDKWKVVVSSANAGGQKRGNQIAVFDNHSAFGRARVALKTFNTEAEANNFFKYANSELIRFSFLMTDESLTSLAKKVPDIIDYTDGNPFIDFSKDINEQLYTLFKIDEKSQEHIKKVLAAKRK